MLASVIMVVLRCCNDSGIWVNDEDSGVVVDEYLHYSQWRPPAGASWPMRHGCSSPPLPAHWIHPC